MKRKNYIGKKFGRLVVLDMEYRENKKGHKNKHTLFFKVKCDCGTEKFVQYTNVQNKSVVSCGCFQKESIGLRSRKEKGESIKRSIWTYYKRNAFTRNIKWNLTYKEFEDLIMSNCYWCGEKDVTETKINSWASLKHVGIDRLDNTKDYNNLNCVPCCKFCNLSKLTRSETDFIKWIEKIYIFQKNKGTI